jgi:hypothetical protein
LEIDFKLGGNGSQFTTRGWHNPEPHGTWTNGPESRLHLPNPGANTGYRCKLYLTPHTAPPKLNAQELIISVGGREVFRQQISRGGGYEFDIPAALIGTLASFDLVLNCPAHRSPRELGSNPDPRDLGVLAGSLFLTPSTGITAQVAPAPLVAVPLSKPPKIAAITMVYNEKEYVPIWLRHYGKHVGIENCFIVDHGSSDGSTANLGACNVVRIPRSPYEPHKQSAFNSTFCSSLLNWYDWIIYSDVDEIVLPDPRISSSLVEYCRRPLPDVITAIGLNVQHRPDAEPALDLGRPVTTQRAFVFGCSPMCKPLLTRRPIVWSPGSHSADAPMVFDHLYMFHLRWFDLPIGLQRLQRTRAMEWARRDAGAQARLPDEQMVQQYRGFAGMPQMTDIDFDPKQAPLDDFLNKVVASRIGREQDLYKIDLNIWCGRLWKIPERFVGAF